MDNRVSKGPEIGNDNVHVAQQTRHSSSDKGFYGGQLGPL